MLNSLINTLPAYTWPAIAVVLALCWITGKTRRDRRELQRRRNADRDHARLLAGVSARYHEQ